MDWHCFCQQSSDLAEKGRASNLPTGSISNTSIPSNVLTALSGYETYSGTISFVCNVFGWVPKNTAVYVEVIEDGISLCNCSFRSAIEGKNNFQLVVFDRSNPSLEIKVKHDAASACTFGANISAIIA